MEDEPKPPRLRLKWRQTLEDKEADYVAEAPSYNGSVGRIYLHDTGGYLKGSWFWAFQAFGATSAATSARPPAMSLLPELPPVAWRLHGSLLLLGPAMTLRSRSGPE